MAMIYFKSDVRRLMKRAYDEGFLYGVKYQKGRTPKARKIRVQYVA